MELSEVLVFGISGITAAFLAVMSVYVVNQWEKTIVLRWGKIVRIAEPGFHIKIPIVDSTYTIDLRTQTIDLSSQVAITKDNISVGIDAVVFMKIEDPKKLLLNVDDYEGAVAKYAQSTMRDLVGKYSLNDVLAQRDKLAVSLKQTIDELTNKWGIDVTNVEIQDIALPEDMKRSFAVQAESARESQAIIIKSNAELEASENYKKAAINLKENNAMQLRILETVKQVSKDQSNTILFALPMETMQKVGISGLAAMASINSSDGRRRKAEVLSRQEEEIDLAKQKTELKDSKNESENLEDESEEEEQSDA